MNDKQRKALSLTSSIIGIVLCIILVPLLLCNLILITKSIVRPNDVPDIFGYKPFIVLSPSMQKPADREIPYDNHINKGDLIFVKTINPDALKIGDIITFREKNSTVTTTHRIANIITLPDGEIVFRTRGDNNNTDDTASVHKSQVEGIYLSRIAGIGNFAMFMQEPTGIIIFITVPLALFFIGYMLKNKNKSKTKVAATNGDQDTLLKEKEELQKQLELMKAQLTQSAPSEVITATKNDLVVSIPILESNIDSADKAEIIVSSNETVVADMPIETVDKKDDIAIETTTETETKAKTTTPKTATPKSSVAKTATAKSTVATKTATAKSTVAKTATPKSTATKTATAKSTAAKTTTAKSLVAKETEADTTKTNEKE